MRRLDGPFTAFRLWWRGASSGPRSRAVAAGAATAAFLVWIAVPSGGGLMPSFAAGLPTSATIQQANATAPPPGQGSQLPSSASDLAMPSVLSPGAAGLSSDASVGSPSGDSGMGGSLSPDSGGETGAPGPGATPSPTTPSSTCPASFPSTGTPLDSLGAQLSALCGQVLGGGSGTVPAGTLPGGGSAARAGAGASPVPRQWLYLNAPIGASGAPNSRWGLPLSAEMAGRSPTVLVGLVQGSPVSPALAGAVGDLVRRGALVELLLVPEPTAAGGAPAFASWLTQALAALEPVQLVEIGSGAAPSGSSPATVAAYTAAGLAAARDAAGVHTVGVSWLDGGTTNTDPAVWSSLDSAGVWSKASFVAASLDAAGACTWPAAFAATLHRYPSAAALPVVSEAMQGPAPPSWIAADYGCLEGAVARGPAASVAMWRLWEGPVPR